MKQSTIQLLLAFLLFMYVYIIAIQKEHKEYEIQEYEIQNI